MSIKLLAVRRATSRKAREVAHPQCFRVHVQGQPHLILSMVMWPTRPKSVKDVPGRFVKYVMGLDTKSANEWATHDRNGLRFCGERWASSPISRRRRNRLPGLTMQAPSREGELPFGRRSECAYTRPALQAVRSARLQMIPGPVSAQPWQ